MRKCKLGTFLIHHPRRALSSHGAQIPRVTNRMLKPGQRVFQMIIYGNWFWSHVCFYCLSAIKCHPAYHRENKTLETGLSTYNKFLKVFGWATTFPACFNMNLLTSKGQNFSLPQRGFVFKVTMKNIQMNPFLQVWQLLRFSIESFPNCFFVLSLEKSYKVAAVLVSHQN